MCVFSFHLRNGNRASNRERNPHVLRYRPHRPCRRRPRARDAARHRRDSGPGRAELSSRARLTLISGSREPETRGNQPARRTGRGRRGPRPSCWPLSRRPFPSSSVVPTEIGSVPHRDRFEAPGPRNGTGIPARDRLHGTRARRTSWPGGCGLPPRGLHPITPAPRFSPLARARSHEDASVDTPHRCRDRPAA